MPGNEHPSRSTDGQDFQGDEPVSPLSDSSLQRSVNKRIEKRRAKGLPDDVSPTHSPHRPAVRKPSQTSSTSTTPQTCWTSIKQWKVWRYIFRIIPYFIAAAEVSLMLAIGFSGNKLVPPQWRYMFCQVEKYQLGALGYCDMIDHTCTQKVLYQIPAISPEVYQNTIIVSALLLLVGLGGLLALISYMLLITRLWARRASCCLDCASACTSCCGHFYDPEKHTKGLSEIRKLETWWFEITMTFTFLWTLGCRTPIILWQSSLTSTDLLGARLLTATLIIGILWFPLGWFYRSTYKNVRPPKQRPKRRLLGFR